MKSEPLQAGGSFTVETEDEAKRLEAAGHKRVKTAPAKKSSK
jgi:hypothetical protein